MKDDEPLFQGTRDQETGRRIGKGVGRVSGTPADAGVSETPVVSPASSHGHTQPGMRSRPHLHHARAVGSGTRLLVEEHNPHGTCDAPTRGVTLAASGWAERETGLAWMGSMKSLLLQK
jgi:hypothetical protein